MPQKTDYPDDVSSTLDQAKGWDMEKCLILGTDVDDNLCIGGSFTNEAEVCLLLSRAQNWLMNAARTEDGFDD